MRRQFWGEIIKNYGAMVFGLALILPIMLINLLDVPRGLTVDEAAFGLNASLLARTGRDENGRLLPIFVLSLGGKDWRQPVTQYYQTVFFKLFGAGVYNLRLSSVVVTAVAAVLIYELIRRRYKSRGLAMIGMGLFLLTPIVWIQSHMGLDNNMPVVWSLIWLLGLEGVREEKKVDWKKVVMMAMALGFAFYSYKGMRVVVPVWAGMTTIYLAVIKRDVKRSGLFVITMLPFAAIIPWLEIKYAGAIMGGAEVKFTEIYQFFYPYLSYFDPTFLWIKGDATVFHSTGRHGMLLLATMPLVAGGLVAMVKEGGGGLVLAALGLAPMLMGTVDSVHRASRIMAVVPLYVILMIEGLRWWAKRVGRWLVVIAVALVAVNFWDFWTVYGGEYAKVTEENFGNLKYFKAYEVAKNLGGQVYVSKAVKMLTGESGRFFEEVYFSGKAVLAESEEEVDSGVVLSRREVVEGWRVIGCFGERQVVCVHQR